MYCSGCGVGVAQGLSYCKNCGTKLNGQDAGLPVKVRPESLIFAILATFVFGIGAITVLIGVLKAALRLDNDEIIPIAVVPFLVMLLLEFVFVRLLLRQTRNASEGKKVKLKGQITKELDAAHAYVLSEPVGSVTENTTRAFDPVHTQRNSK